MLSFKLFKHVLVIAVLSSGFSANAEGVDIQSVLKEAMGDSLVIQNAKANLDEAYWKKTENLDGFLPKLQGSVNYLGMKKYMFIDVNFGGGPVSVPQILPNTIYSLTASMPLFDGFASMNRYWAGQSFESSAQQGLDWSQFSTERQVRLLFYKSLAAKALVEVAQQNNKVLQDHLKDVKALQKAGVATPFEVLRVEVQLSESQTEMLNAQDEYEMSKFKLGEALGKEKETRDLVGTLPVVKISDLKSVEGAKPDDRADLKALKYKTDAMKYLDKANGRFWVPNVSAYGQYQYYNNLTEGFNDNESFREAYQIGVNLTWNLFDGMSSVAKSQQSAAAYLQSQKSFEMAKLRSAQDIEFWKRKLIFFQAVFESRSQDVERSKESLRLAREGRRVGTRTLSDVLDAELDLFRSEAGQVNSQIGAIEAVLNLEMATGRSIYSFN
jgi:outer membrane protein TolC